MSEHVWEQPLQSQQPPLQSRAVDVALPPPDIKRRGGKPPSQRGVTVWWFLLVIALAPPIFLERYYLVAFIAVLALLGAVGVSLFRIGVFTWRRWSARPLNLYAQGKHGQAEACFEAALARANGTFGQDDFRRGFILTQLADYAANAADFARAEPLYQEALRILCGAIEEHAAEYFYCLNNYATMLINWKRHGKGAALLELAVQVVEPYARETANVLARQTAHVMRFNLIHVLTEEGRLAEAERLIDEWDHAAQVKYFHVGTVGEVIAAADARLACAKGHYQEALEWCDRVARMPELTRLARCQALFGLGRHDEAATAAHEAVNGFAALARTHPVFIEFDVLLAQCCLAKGDVAGAKRWRDEARAIATEHGLLDQPVWTEAVKRWRHAAQSLGPEAAAAWEK
jgi:tetratricopeptide (TPR) repeat protein